MTPLRIRSRFYFSKKTKCNQHSLKNSQPCSGKVNVKQIVDYDAGYEEYSKTKNKTLTKAIEIAQGMHQKSKGEFLYIF